MFRIFVTAAVGLASVLCAHSVVAQSQEVTPPEGITWLALRDINDFYFDLDDPTNRPPLTTAAPEGMIRAVDVSPDGRPDWLIDYGASGLASMCGTGGCRQRLYVSDGDHYVRAVDAQTLELTVRQGQVDVWVHHLYCSDGSRDCRYSFAWNPETLTLDQRAGSSGGSEAWRPIEAGEDE